VRYRDPDRRERSKTFLRKIDAEEFARSVETDIRRGDYLDPAAGKVTLESWAEEWFGTIRHLKPKTREGYEGILRKHILPRLGRRSLASVKPIDIRRFVSELVDAGYSPQAHDPAPRARRQVVGYERHGSLVHVAPPCSAAFRAGGTAPA
jgi:Phage integrase, N-terminal SAM-like domain